MQARPALIQGPGIELNFVPCQIVRIKLTSCVACCYCRKWGARTHLSSQVETSERKNEALPRLCLMICICQLFIGNWDSIRPVVGEIKNLQSFAV